MVKMTAETVQLSGSAPFRFLDLPLELRRLVYNQALISPDKTLQLPHRGRVRQRSGTQILAIGLLGTCSQIRGEASSTHYEANTFLAVAKATITGYEYPAMGRKSIPSHIQPRIEHMFLVFEVLDGGTNYNHCDFRQLQGFTGLRTVRIAIITYQNWTSWTKDWAEVLCHAIQRVPAGCEVGFGSRSDVERDFIRKNIRPSLWLPEAVRHYGGAVELNEDVLGGIAKGLSCVQGSKSGTDYDYRCDYGSE
jgi:hypothetical protein